MEQLLQSGPVFTVLSLRTTNSVQEKIFESSSPPTVDRGGAVVAVADSGCTSAVGKSKVISYLSAINLIICEKQMTKNVASATKDGMKKGDPANFVHKLSLDPPAIISL